MLKDLGVYIEKFNNQYLYTLWINTQGYPMLGCDGISPANRKFYEKILESILKANKEKKGSFEIMGMGIETNICYEKKLKDVILDSQNISLWILNGNEGLKESIAARYHVRKVENLHILEKQA